MSKEWCWAATVCAASAEIISQTKLVGKTAEEHGRDTDGTSPVLLAGRKPNDIGLSKD